jgi:Na+/H+ antiporter NhaD/arsenite permease-like protein
VDTIVLAVFGLVYLGMLLGEIPGLALDRTGVALLGALALVATERVTPAQAWAAVDVPTLALLFGLMVVSAQLRLGGFYTWVTRRIVAAEVSPAALLAALVAVAGALSAVLANDIVCLAVAPLLIEGCLRRRLDPVPFLLALACAANVGSAATLIGNPQNMLIGQTLHLPFAGFLADALVPAVVGLAAVWGVLVLSTRGRWSAATDLAPERPVDATPFDGWQTLKGLLVLALLVLGFLFAPVPREVLALAGAAVLLTSRRMASRDLIGLVDWHLLVLFIGLFVVNHAVAEAGLPARAGAALAGAGVDLGDPRWLFPVTTLLSNLVSNVPAVMLLLPHATHPLAGPVLALSSTLAGNLLIVGSIANIIVVEQAQALGVTIGWRRHARVGIPVTLVTLALAAGWLWLRAGGRVR